MDDDRVCLMCLAQCIKNKKMVLLKRKKEIQREKHECCSMIQILLFKFFILITMLLNIADFKIRMILESDYDRDG